MILVTGGAGFIGSHLVEALVLRGDRVRVLDDLSSGDRHNLAALEGSVDFVEGSIGDPAVVRRSLKDVRVVLHHAAVPSVVRSFDEALAVHETNATGTLVVLEEAAAAGVERLVFAGSSAAYGDAAGEALGREDMREDPGSPYAAQKVLGEHYCQIFARHRGLHTVVLRYFNVFGPRQDPGSPYSGVISLFCTQLLRGEIPTIFGDGLQTRDFVAVEDVVQANLRAIEAEVAPGSCYNIAGGQSLTVLELYQRIARLVGVEEPPRFAPPRPGEIRHSRADIGRAQRELGYQPRADQDAALGRTVEWYRPRSEPGTAAASGRARRDEK